MSSVNWWIHTDCPRFEAITGGGVWGGGVGLCVWVGVGVGGWVCVGVCVQII